MQTFCDIFHYRQYRARLRIKASSKRKIDPQWDKIRREVKRLDGNRCRLCGGRTSLQVHHIIYRSEQGSDDINNLITLCAEHHDLIHSNKKYYQAQCHAVVAARAEGRSMIIKKKFNG